MFDDDESNGPEIIEHTPQSLMLDFISAYTIEEQTDILRRTNDLAFCEQAQEMYDILKPHLNPEDEDLIPYREGLWR